MWCFDVEGEMRKNDSITLVELFERWKQEIKDLRRERNDRFLKSLTPFEQWMYYSKDMGDYRSRRKYFLSPEGEKEIEKRFGENLDLIPDDWEETSKTIEYDELGEIRDFFKGLFTMFSKSWGMN
jgi:hypothetical protein